MSNTHLLVPKSKSFESETCSHIYSFKIVPKFTHPFIWILFPNHLILSWIVHHQPNSFEIETQISWTNSSFTRASCHVPNLKLKLISSSLLNQFNSFTRPSFPNSSHIVKVKARFSLFVLFRVFWFFFLGFWVMVVQFRFHIEICCSHMW